MSWIDLGIIALQYSPSVIVLVIIFICFKPVYKWMKEIEKRLDCKAKKLVELENKMMGLHSGCNVPLDAIEKLQGQVSTLEEKDNSRDIELKGISTKLSNVEVMTTAMYKHFFEEGIKSGRRSEDK